MNLLIDLLAMTYIVVALAAFSIGRARGIGWLASILVGLFWLPNAFESVAARRRECDDDLG